MGQISGRVIPRQPGEDDIQSQQELFLAKVRQEYGKAGLTLTDMIQQFWFIQDRLARTLNGDTFEQMINRGQI
jgi:hypothetical protein